jgi:hypothetical protein
LASWLALTHGSEVTMTDWKVKICHKNVAMSAAHETLTFGAGGKGTGVPGFGGLTVSDHSAHQHTSYVERAAGVSVVGAATLTDQPVRPLITRARVLAQHSNVGKSARVSSFSPRGRPHGHQSGRNGSKATATTFGGASQLRS